MLNRLFRSDFTDYKVIETKEFNSCGENIHTLYHIEFARYIFGIKFYIDFYNKRGCLGGYYKVTKTSFSEDVIIHQYKCFVRDLCIKQKITVITPTEKICG